MSSNRLISYVDRIVKEHNWLEYGNTVKLPCSYIIADEVIAILNKKHSDFNIKFIKGNEYYYHYFTILKK